MSYTALYRKWRPLVFEDVVDQEHVVKTLKNSITTDRIAHAYLFCGTRGTGKTTMAKIFSRAINCLNPKNSDPCNECDICKEILSGNSLDVIEMDAASNNSVDNVREIKDEVKYLPTKSKYKVYIIDEVHMLSIGAFNALLKTLEEPPKHVVFILATTEPHKLPVTILSRCQRFDFKRIKTQSIVDRILSIAKSNNVILKEEAASLIAKISDGALRDAISILDQCISIGNSDISYDDVLSVVGIVNNTVISDMVDSIQLKDIKITLLRLNDIIESGKEISPFLSDLILYYRNLLIFSIANDTKDIMNFSEDMIARMKIQCKNISKETLIYIIKELSVLESSIKWASRPKVLLEVALIKLCEAEDNIKIENILDRIAKLEKDISEKSIITTNINTEKQDKQASTCKFAPNNKPINIKPIEAWSKVLNELKSSGRVVLYTNLLNTTLVELEKNIYGILFSKDSTFNKMLVSKPENLETVESAVKKLLGTEITLKCITENAINCKSDNFIDKVEEIARKNNVPLNIIDE